MVNKKQLRDYLKELRKYKRKQLNKEIELVEDLLDGNEGDVDIEFGPGSNPPPPPPPPPRP